MLLLLLCNRLSCFYFSVVPSFYFVRNENKNNNNNNKKCLGCDVDRRQGDRALKDERRSQYHVP